MKAKLPRRPSSEDLEAPLTDSAAGSPSSSGRLERRTLPSSSGGVYLSEVQLNQARMRSAHSGLFKRCAGKLSIAQPDEAASVRMYSIKVRYAFRCACAARDFQYQHVAHCAKKYWIFIALRAPGRGSESDEDLASEPRKIIHWRSHVLHPHHCTVSCSGDGKAVSSDGAGHAATSASFAYFTFFLFLFVFQVRQALFRFAWTEALTPACRKNPSIRLLHGPFRLMQPYNNMHPTGVAWQYADTWAVGRTEGAFFIMSPQGRRRGESATGGWGLPTRAASRRARSQ